MAYRVAYKPLEEIRPMEKYPRSQTLKKKKKLKNTVLVKFFFYLFLLA